MQGADGVEHGVARGELVVHQHQRRIGDSARQGGPTEVARQQARVLREQQMGGGVRVGLLEAARPRHALDGAARRVEVRRHAQPVGDRVAEAGGRLRVAEHDRPARLGVTEQRAHLPAEFESGAVHHGGLLRHVLAEHVGHEEVGPLGVAAQGESQQVLQLPVTAGLPVTDELDAQSLRHPAARPHHVRRLLLRRCRSSGPAVHPAPTRRDALAPRPALIPRGPRPAAPRSRRPAWPRRRPRPATGSARPRRGAASPRSSCSCTRNA